jgi:hypothetical protein
VGLEWVWEVGSFKYSFAGLSTSLYMRLPGRFQLPHIGTSLSGWGTCDADTFILLQKRQSSLTHEISGRGRCSAQAC